MRVLSRPSFFERGRAGGRIDAEAAPVVPALDVADRAQARLQAFLDARRLGERAGDRVLEAQELLGALLLRDVAAYTVVALELARCVDDRLTGDRKHQISVRVRRWISKSRNASWRSSVRRLCSK